MDGVGTDEALRSLAQIEGELHGVQQALERLDAGTYGVCQRCGELLPAEILSLDPLATACAHHDPPPVP